MRKLLLVLGVVFIVWLLWSVTRPAPKGSAANPAQPPRSGCSGVLVGLLGLLAGSTLAVFFVVVALALAKSILRLAASVDVHPENGQSASFSGRALFAVVVFAGVLFWIVRRLARVRAKLTQLQADRRLSKASAVKKSWSIQQLWGRKK